MSADEADEPERDAQFLRAFLAGHDAPCPQCQYNLRNLVGNRCPECGEQIVVRVSLVEPKLGAMIAGLVGLSAGAGFSGLLLIYLLIQMLMRHGFLLTGWQFLRMVGIPLVIEGLLTVIWIVKRREIRRMQRVRGVWLVIGAWVATLVNIIVFSVWIR